MISYIFGREKAREERLSEGLTALISYGSKRAAF